MLKPKLTPGQTYLAALVAVSIATLVTLPARAWMGDRVPFVFYFAAVALSAGLGGLGPGILATALSTAFAVLIATAGEMPRGARMEAVAFGLVGLLTSALSEILRASYLRAEAARAELEKERRRAAFLAEASAIMDQSLDYNDTLSRVVKLMVPAVADACAIDLAEEGRGIRQIAAAHSDPAKTDLVRRLQCRYPLDSQGRNPVQHVLASGQPAVHQDISDRVLIQTARDPEHLEALRALGVRSYACVPLVARGRTLGALMLMSASRSRYAPRDIAFAQDLARRAALAVDNAQLYGAAQQELDYRRETQAVLSRNQQEIAALNARLQRALTETHHRVKNNLQIIAAMVDMQALEATDPVYRTQFQRLGASVRTLATIHDILTQAARQSGDAREVSARAILDKLIPLMQETAAGRRISYCADDLPVTAQQGTSLALLVNELVSNALKHSQGEVQVQFAVQNGSAVLQVMDDGQGFPPGFQPSEAANTGLDLVESLSRWDLGGQTHYENRPEGGACVRVIIPVRKQGDSQDREERMRGDAAA